MSIEKKSLISTLKATKKANVVSTGAPEASHKISKATKRPTLRATKAISKATKRPTLRATKRASLRAV